MRKIFTTYLFYAPSRDELFTVNFGHRYSYLEAESLMAAFMGHYHWMMDGGCVI